MTNKQEAFQASASTIIKNLDRRGMEGYFFKDAAACKKAIFDSVPKGSSITWGGSESIKEIGLMEDILSGDYQALDRTTAKTADERRAFYGKAVMADYFLMSTNALTLDGELINIDGNGNRVACLIHGPRYVYIVVGMNKIVSDVESGIARVRNFAAPPNAVRLNKETPCKYTGRCGDCLSVGSMCNHIVVTRHNGEAGRIKVFLVAEDLGY